MATASGRVTDRPKGRLVTAHSFGLREGGEEPLILGSQSQGHGHSPHDTKVVSPGPDANVADRVPDRGRCRTCAGGNVCRRSPDGAQASSIEYRAVCQLMRDGFTPPDVRQMSLIT